MPQVKPANYFWIYDSIFDVGRGSGERGGGATKRGRGARGGGGLEGDAGIERERQEGAREGGTNKILIRGRRDNGGDMERMEGTEGSEERFSNEVGKRG